MTARVIALAALSRSAHAMTAKPTTPSLPALHEAIVSPLGRKYSRAQAWRPAAGALRVELMFEEPDLVDAKPTRQAVYYDLDPGAVGPAVRVPVGSDLKLQQHFQLYTMGFQEQRHIRCAAVGQPCE